MKKNKISDLINQKLSNLVNNSDNKEKEKEFGIISSISDGVILIEGLNEVLINEILELENGQKCLAMNLDYNYIAALLLENDEKDITIGQKVFRTKKEIQALAGDEFLGRIIDPLCNAIDGKGSIKSNQSMPMERTAPGIMTRKSVFKPLETGIKIIDSLIPVGRGQRELIIGDRKTGKTSIAIDAIINQKGKNVKCVYVAIGQKNSTIVNIKKTLEENGALDYTTIVASSASDSPTLKFIAPFIGTAISEYWCDNGQDVLIVYDDLTKHADAYRSLSLLLRRPPGREAYPGDVFYLHSRLLERSLQYSKDKNLGSLTALPIIETQNNDLSAYVPTNVISITDGQIFLDASLFNQGQRPAVNIGPSVSRVGSDAQTKAIKEVSSSIKLDLAQYNELKAFSQFGSDLDAATTTILKKGEIITKLLNQKNNSVLSTGEITSILYLIKSNLINELEIKNMENFEELFLAEMNNYQKETIDDINKTGELSKNNIKAIEKSFRNVLKNF